MGYFADKLTATFPIAAPYIRRLQGEGVGATLVRGAGGAFIVNVTGTGLIFATHVVLARVLGASSYGNFAYAMTWLSLLVLFGKLGLDTASLRFVAEYNGAQKWGLMKGFVERSSQVSLAASVFVALTTATVIWIVRDRLEPELATTFWLVCLILPIRSLLLVRGASLRGLKKVVKAQSAQKIVRPAALLVIVVFFYFLSTDIFNATTVMAMNLAAFAGALLFVAVFFKKAFPKEAADTKSEYMAWTWTRVALPMLLISTMTQTQNQVDVLIIGFFLESEQVGIYAAAKKITMLIVFGLTAVNLMVTPMISELWHQGRKKELQRMLTLGARGIFAFTLPVSLIMIVFGREVLAIFGAEFSLAYWPLVILTVAQTINSLAGSVGLVMIMTGHQRNASIIVGLSLFLNIVLNIFLVPAFEIEGAAISMAATLVFWNITMVIYVSNRIKLNPTIISIRKETK